MSQVSFITFCVEFYANHTGRSSPEVYQQFESSGLLALLQSDYGDLHGMSMEYMMQFIDDYFKENKK